MALNYSDTRRDVRRNQAYAAGYAAGQIGGKRNPYPKGTVEYVAWENGRRQGEAGRMR